MRKSTKAALLSGLVFPGIGHLYLRRYVLGVLLVGGAAALFYFVISVAIETAIDIAAEIQNGGTPMDAGAISALVSERSQGSEASTSIATIAWFGLWTIGIIDSYRQGRRDEKADDAGAVSGKETP